MVTDTFRDVTRGGEIVPHLFDGSGTTLIAAVKTSRVARLLELDSNYCDVICKRYVALTGVAPILADTGQLFVEITDIRKEGGASEDA